MPPNNVSAAADTAASSRISYDLTPGELAKFDATGYLGPFDLLDEDQASRLSPTLEGILNGGLHSPIYGRTTHRDWHLRHRNLMSPCYRPEVQDRVRSLLGPNLLVWRTSIFHKAPGDGDLAWHQSSLFAGEEYGIFKPALAPPPELQLWTDMFNLSVWVAFDDVTAENGAMQIARGSHVRQWPVRRVPLRQSVFGRVFVDNLVRSGDQTRLAELDERFAVETIFDPEVEGLEVDTIEMRRGQFMIFTDRVMHCSLPNRTDDQRRLAMNFRVTTPEVVVYPHREWGEMVDGNDHDISRHACVMMCGEDRVARNVYIN